MELRSSIAIAALSAALALPLHAAASSGMEPYFSADQVAAAKSLGITVRAPVQGDTCVAPDSTSVNPFLISSTTVGATNNYDIATVCGSGQTLFGGTGASLDVAFGVVTDANCSVTVSGDPTGTSWDLALYVLQAPGAACTALPALADAQCITMDDNGGGNTTETVTFAATAGTEYYVIVDGFNTATGTFDLNISGAGCNLVGLGAGAQADLGITKTDGVAASTPGSSTTYTITANNAGPNPANPATVTDNFPAACTGVTWTCVGAGGGTCTASGSGNINDATVNLPNGASVTYTAICPISAGATGTLVNTATVSSAVADPVSGNNSATDTNTLGTSADLSITKTDGVAGVTAGSTTTYTIVASNAGPNAANPVTVADTFPAACTSVSWTCAGTGGGTCTASGTGNINDGTVNLPSGGSVTYTAACQISGAATGTLSNTATVSSAVSDPNTANNSATDIDSITGSADLSITKTDNVTSVAAGSSTTYVIVASNAGPGASVAVVADTFPAACTSVTWTCTSAGGGTCPNASGTGNINELPSLPVGGSATYSAVCAISAGATGTVVNTATISSYKGSSDPSPANNSATDTNTVGVGIVGVLSSNIAFGPQALNAAVQRTLTITNTGTGPLSVTGISAVTAPFAQIAGGTCPATTPFPLAAGASCTVLYTFTPTTAGTFSQIVTITADVGTATATLSGTGVSVIQLPLGGQAMWLLLGLLTVGSLVVLHRRG